MLDLTKSGKRPHGRWTSTLEMSSGRETLPILTIIIKRSPE